MARNEVNRARFRRIAQFSEWLTGDGLELIFDTIGVLRYIRGGDDRGAAARATSRSDVPADASPRSALSKSVSAKSRGAKRDIDRTNSSSSPKPKEPGAGQPISENGARKMDRQEKMRLREHIGKHVDVSGTRLTDDEAQRLAKFIDDYDSHRGQSRTRTWSSDGWSSDGKYTRQHRQTDTFTEEVGIRQDYSYQDDDGQTDSSFTEITDARGILNRLKDHG
jgi:hypothetical protein